MGATGRGDKGKTTILSKKDIWKDSIIVEVEGTIDELNAILGMCRLKVKNNEIKEELKKIQDEMFIVGYYISNYFSKMNNKKIDEKRIEKIEKRIKELMPLHEKPRFIRPYGSEGAIMLHIARTLIRKLERRIITMIKIEGAKEDVWGLIKYINRLSDLFYYYALLENKENNIKEEYI